MTPEEKREKQREYDQKRGRDPARRAAVNERGKRYRQRHPERIKAYQEANKERLRERKREYQAANRDKARAASRRYHATHAEEERERMARWREANREQIRARYAISTHGPDVHVAFAAMWEQQEGRCYLCEELMTATAAVIDHDHACCGKGKSCAKCRRGLACHRCNRLIGHVGDDVELMRKIASNLEGKIMTMNERASAK